MAFNPQMFGGGLGGILGGLFGNSGGGYEDAMKQYQDYMNRSKNEQQPYADAGKGALGNYQTWLEGQKDPSKFINDQMKNYNQSDYAHNLTQQAMNAGQNAASAEGTMGSTPMMQQMQQNAGQIASQDQNQWLQHVLGINTQYGQGQNNLVNTGQNSANQLTNMYNNMGGKMGEAAYGQHAGKQQDFWNTLGGGIGLIGSFF